MKSHGEKWYSTLYLSSINQNWGSKLMQIVSYKPYFNNEERLLHTKSSENNFNIIYIYFMLIF